jgi:hypothetical protein
VIHLLRQLFKQGRRTLTLERGDAFNGDEYAADLAG